MISQRPSRWIRKLTAPSEKRLGVSLDELLAWHKEEIEKTRAEVFEIASKLELPEGTPKTMKEVSDVLFRYAGPRQCRGNVYTCQKLSKTYPCCRS